MRQTVWAVRNGESLIRLLSSAQAHVNPQWQGFLQMIDRLLWQGKGTFAAGHGTAQEMIERMKRHNEEVQADVPAERLLVWSVDEGWEPLCEFLEVPVPDVEFPHINDRAEFLNRIIDGSLQTLTEWRAAGDLGRPGVRRRGLTVGADLRGRARVRRARAARPAAVTVARSPGSAARPARRTITSPLPSSACWTRRPLTKVPLELRSSRMRAPDTRGTRIAWRRETELSSRCRSAASPRPMWITSPATGISSVRPEPWTSM